MPAPCDSAPIPFGWRPLNLRISSRPWRDGSAQAPSSGPCRNRIELNRGQRALPSTGIGAGAGGVWWLGAPIAPRKPQSRAIAHAPGRWGRVEDASSLRSRTSQPDRPRSVGVREGAGEASVKGSVGWVSSRESALRCADPVGKWGGQHGAGRHGESCGRHRQRWRSGRPRGGRRSCMRRCCPSTVTWPPSAGPRDARTAAGRCIRRATAASRAADRAGSCPEHDKRLWFCCALDGCRSRETPPGSVRGGGQQ